MVFQRYFLASDCALTGYERLPSMTASLILDRAKQTNFTTLLVNRGKTRPLKDRPMVSQKGTKD